MVYTYYSVLYGEFENKKNKEQKNWPSRVGIQNLDFLKFAPTIWIIEGDEIKSRQGS